MSALFKSIIEIVFGISNAGLKNAGRETVFSHPIQIKIEIKT